MWWYKFYCEDCKRWCDSCEATGAHPEYVKNVLAHAVYDKWWVKLHKYGSYLHHPVRMTGGEELEQMWKILQEAQDINKSTYREVHWNGKLSS